MKVLSDWEHSISQEKRDVEKIVSQFDTKQCRCLYNGEPLYVSKEQHRLQCKLCSKRRSACEKCKKQSDGTYLVDGVLEIEMRKNVISYLNSLEIVAIAWHEQIVDAIMIETQFVSLYDVNKDESLLQNFRSIAGNGTAYPILDMFCSRIKYNHEHHTKKTIFVSRAPFI